jgi:NTE family protein
VYDNQGMHKISRQGAFNSNIVITSDAGGGSNKELSISNTLSLLSATVETFMTRIKRFQMMDQIYDNTDSENREIAYLSLAWDPENCIPGFIKNLEKKQIADIVIKELQLKDIWIDDPKSFVFEITEHLKKKIRFSELSLPTEEERHIARSVGTNLTALSKTQIDCLIKQAEVLTQIQVSLYCPSLITTS